MCTVMLKERRNLDDLRIYLIHTNVDQRPMKIEEMSEMDYKEGILPDTRLRY